MNSEVRSAVSAKHVYKLQLARSAPYFSLFTFHFSVFSFHFSLYN